MNTKAIQKRVEEIIKNSGIEYTDSEKKELTKKLTDEELEREAIINQDADPISITPLPIPKINNNVERKTNSNPLNKICALWCVPNSNVLSGNSGNMRFSVIPNTKKTKPTQPDFNLTLSYSWTKEQIGLKGFPPSLFIGALWYSEDWENGKNSGNLNGNASDNVRNFIILANDERTTDKSPHYFLYEQFKYNGD